MEGIAAGIAVDAVAVAAGADLFAAVVARFAARVIPGDADSAAVLLVAPALSGT